MNPVVAGEDPVGLPPGAEPLQVPEDLEELREHFELEEGIGGGYCQIVTWTTAFKALFSEDLSLEPVGAEACLAGLGGAADDNKTALGLPCTSLSGVHIDPEFTVGEYFSKGRGRCGSHPNVTWGNGLGIASRV
jgi:hypothetical protein